MFSSFTAFVGKQWFLIGLVCVMLLGYFASDSLAWMTDAKTLRACIVAFVIFMTALPIETQVIRDTLRRPTAALLGTFMNFGILPLIGWGLSYFLRGELALGFLVLAATPCTVASAAVWTRRAGGNDVVALMVTVITNLSSFVLTSMWLGLMTKGDVHDAAISPWKMIGKLALLIFLPILLAQVFRQSPSVADLTRTHKKRMSIITQIGLLCIVTFGAVHCGLRLKQVDWSQSNLASQLVLMLILCIVLHTVCLFLGRTLGQKIGLPTEDWIAVGFAGSQKTLAVGLQVGLMVGGGIVILPMVAYHFLQLFIDTLVADQMQIKDIKSGS